MRTLLEERGCVVCGIVRTGEDAIRRCEQLAPDVVLMDLHLEGEMTGIEAAKTILSQCRVPVIFITSEPDEQMLHHASTVAASALLTKPVRTHELVAAIKFALARNSQAQPFSASEEEFKRVIQSIEGIIWESDLQRNSFSFVSRQAASILGYSPSDWVSTPDFWRKHVFHEDAPVIEQVEQRLIRSQSNYTLRYRMISANGRIVWLKDVVSVVRTEEGPIRLCGVMEDITRQKLTEQKLLESKEQYRDLIEAAPDMIYSLSSVDGVITMLNPAFEKCTGFDSINFIGRSFISLIHPDDLNLAIARYQRIISGEFLPPVELRFRTARPGEYLFCEITSRPIVQNANVTGVIEVVRDITERKMANEKLLHHALYDPLTGLANRTLFMDRLNHSITRIERNPKRRFAVLFIDLDRFKLVNDSLGHILGDELLKQAAYRLRRCLRPEDTVARIGGDEFVVLIEKADEALDVSSVAERIQTELKTPFVLNSHDVFTTASIGVAFSTHDYKTAEEILRDADTAMYRAKSSGRARFEIFDEAMHHHVMFTLRMETDLRKAIDSGQLQMRYQPIVSLSHHHVVGFEALLRWKHPERGLIPASEFIVLAEETGLIHPLGQLAVRTAITQLGEWQKTLGARFPFRVSVNLSAKQFTNPELVANVEALLREASIHPSSLALELTETAFMENRQVVEEMLKELRALRVKIQIDDFGTGYSSLSYLHRFAIDALKVDSSFVHSMNENLEILRTIVDLSKNLGLETIVEGVETAMQAEQLRLLGYDSAQGFFFSPALIAEDVPIYLSKMKFPSRL